MRIQLIVCHPSVSSFNHAIAKKAESVLLSNGHQVILHDLYQESFNPILPYPEINEKTSDSLVAKHIEELLQSDMVIIVHPNWWGKPPAMLSGWIDRVLAFNIAYSFAKGEEGGEPIGLLNLKKAIIFNTSNTTDDREENIFGDPLDSIWKNCVFNFCGVSQVTRKVFNVVVNSTPEERGKWLGEVEQTVLESLED